MASMTDVIFLLLIFFMVTSTLVVPSALKVTLPQSKQQTDAHSITRITIDAELRYYVSIEEKSDQEVSYEDIALFLSSIPHKEEGWTIALYADESVPYREVVRVLNLAVENECKMILATRPLR